MTEQQMDKFAMMVLIQLADIKTTVAAIHGFQIAHPGTSLSPAILEENAANAEKFINDAKKKLADASITYVFGERQPQA
jgi:hypothetical protein